MRHNIETIKKAMLEDADWAIAEVAAFEREIEDSLDWLLTKWHPRSDVEKAKRQAFIDVNRAVLGR